MSSNIKIKRKLKIVPNLKINKNINNIQLEYSQLSKEITSLLSKEVKKENGIYFTPPSCIKKNMLILEPYLDNISTVLEPSCGSCEYILTLNKICENISITGIELNESIYNKIKHLNTNNIQILNEDFLKYTITKKYDLIIGNPPYFVIKKGDVETKYHKYFEGRPNIFVLFVIKSLECLNDNGILSFVLPKSFTNCLYYNKVRKYIYENYQIIDIVECSDDKYIETQQDTILFIVRKQDSINNKDFVLETEHITILSDKKSILKLKNLFKDSTTLSSLGFTVSVGNVVWNQVKHLLTDDETKTRLIYSSDIKNNELIKKTYSNVDKKNYINKVGTNEVMLVVNRGYGVGTYNFDYCLINVEFDYLIENHLICIKYQNKDNNISKEECLNLYQNIIDSLNNPKTVEFIKNYFGNNAINTTELNYILPIYI